MPTRVGSQLPKSCNLSATFGVANLKGEQKLNKNLGMGDWQRLLKKWADPETRRPALDEGAALRSRLAAT